MIDSAAMLLSVAGFALISCGWPKSGYAASLAGSGLWLLFGIAVGSPALILQSLAFSVFSGVGLARCPNRRAA